MQHLNLKGVKRLIFWEILESLDQYKWCLGHVGRQMKAGRSCANLGNEVNDEVLLQAISDFGFHFEARVMWDMKTGHFRGYVRVLWT